jgi:hypothetical protein
MNFDMNQVYDKPQWLTLQEASKITGLNSFTLRKRIKSGKHIGKKVNQNNREVWLVSLDSLGIPKKLDMNRLNVTFDDEPGGEPVYDEPVQETQEKSHGYAELLLNQKDERINDLLHHCGEMSRHNKVLENLLADFQARIGVLESDKSELESKIKLLPAPPETLVSRIQDFERIIQEKEETIKAELDYREQLSAALHEQEARIIESSNEIGELKAELEERKKPWWKKLFTRK